ncbi:hypothetical protein TorRG33x02_069940 [Trema orientale]|uniref:Protein BIG GRAIN 1-like E n=1 Tax=Trema orientale TaxID=63057 RepID=A0A2P5FHK0_TREOI|nr:hypothetical protein TorRG33x02_069940 [Trema orientale]
MSLTGSLNPADPDKLFKKSFHRRNDSGELDVFEAARYFSGYNESCGATSFNQKLSKDQDHHNRAGYWSSSTTRGSGGRISLDMPRRNLNLHHHDHHDHVHHHHVVMEKQIKEKKYKQPSSPGGRLASFLNSLFNQSSSKKKIKSKSTTSTSTQSTKDYDQDDIQGSGSGGGRRKRRSSISHFGSSGTNTTTDSKASSLYSYNSSSSGFRTPPPYAQLTPTKNFRSFSDNHKQLVSTLSKFNNNNVNKAQQQSDHDHDHDDDHHRVKDLLSLSSDQKENKSNIKGPNALSSDHQKDKTNNRVDHHHNHHHHHHHHHDVKKYHESDHQKKELVVLRKFDEEEDEGGDSDSSSDLFELQNYDLGCYSSGLPVYETTNMDSIKRGISSAPISNI